MTSNFYRLTLPLSPKIGFLLYSTMLEPMVSLSSPCRRRDTMIYMSGGPNASARISASRVHFLIHQLRMSPLFRAGWPSFGCVPLESIQSSAALLQQHLTSGSPSTILPSPQDMVLRALLTLNGLKTLCSPMTLASSDSLLHLETSIGRRHTRPTCLTTSLRPLLELPL